MPTPLKILIVEDSQDDEELLLAELRLAGFDPTWDRVETESSYLRQLDQGPDLILSDHTMPQLSGLRAVDLLRERGLDIPFILISGTIGEEVAVDAMKRGATDYLLKDRVARLGSAIARALEQRRMRDEHRRMQQQMALQATALETTANAILVTDMAGRILWVNRAFTTLTGYTAAEVAGKTPRLLKSGKHDQTFYRNFWNTILSGQAWRGEFINRRKDGSLYFDEHTVTPVRSENGDITHFIGVMHDITARKNAEEALRQSEENFRQIAESIHEVFWITDPRKNKMEYVSPAYETIWEQTCKSLYESPASWLDAIHPSDRERVLKAAMAKQSQGDYDETYRIVRLDGAVRWIRDRAFPIRNAAGEVYRLVGTAEDVTEQRSLEQQIRQAQKMECIGQLAAGVAHDFNNLLTVIGGHSQLLEMALPPGDPKSESLVEIQTAVDRAASLTRQLLAFSRQQVLEPRLLNLNTVVTEMQKMLHRLIGEDVSLATVLKPNLHPVKADHSQLDQILLNLAVNARDAMPTGGKLTIETSNVELDENYVATRPEVKPGPYVMLAVTDTGTGMTPETQARVFEPFFTTKSVGKGTGLGLAVVHGIVKQSGGHIAVYSEVNIGTTFKIYLPAMQGMADTPAESDTVKPTTGREVLLLAEDEEIVRKLTAKALENYGYTVVKASNGAEVLQLAESNADRIDLLITDVVMPEMSGYELSQKLRTRHLDVKVLYLSGYTNDAIVRHGILAADMAFLQKPFTPVSLAIKVREVLNQKAVEKL